MKEVIEDETHPTHESIGKFLDSFTKVLISIYKNRKGWKRMDRRLREAVFLAVSAKNRCKFCFMVHSRLAQKAGMSKDEISAIVKEDKSFLDERTWSAIEFALRIRSSNEKVTSDVREEISKNFDTREVDTLESAVKFIIFANKFFNIFFPPLNLGKIESITNK